LPANQNLKPHSIFSSHFSDSKTPFADSYILTMVKMNG